MTSGDRSPVTGGGDSAPITAGGDRAPITAGGDRAPVTGGGNRAPVTVVLPTTRWGTACQQVADQLRPGDELLVVCDAASDPVAGRDAPDGVEVLVAGPPSGCSGKANALAHAMERASNDRFVWTDDDFERDPDWLDHLVAAGERRGPATAVPVPVGDGWWRPFEPLMILTSSATIYLGLGPWGGNAWGGGVTFERSDLDVAALVADLRRCLSDDGVLSEHLGRTAPVRDLRARVPMPGDRATVYHRVVRLARIAHLHEGLWGPLAGSLVAVALAVLFPVYAVLATLSVSGATYAMLDLRRWTALLAPPSLLLAPLVFAAGIAGPPFEWGGRRYRYRGVRDVEVLESVDGDRRRDGGA